MASAMAIVLTLLFSVISTVSSRSISSSPTTQPNQTYGPIITNNHTYQFACDRARFTDLGLVFEDYLYCNKKLSYADRVESLIGSMTLSEKILQLGNKAYGVDRIGLPKYEWWSEALHGVSDQGRGVIFDDVVPHATSFATVILSTASFNETLWKILGQVVSTEARAMHNLGRAGLTFWSPVINVARDPRWGRTLEVNGEDPFVAGRYSVNYVRGLQDIEGSETTEDLNSRPLKVSACCKHLAAYDVDNWFGIYRETNNARVTEQDMVETFNRPFAMCIKDGDVSSVMCSYNRVNGIPTCADPRLLTQTVRGEWQLHGYTVSDCDSIQVMVQRHHFLDDTMEDAVSQVFKAGLDLDCGDTYTLYTESAVKQGKVRETDIDNALKNIYIVLMRLGFFDGQPLYESLGKDDICSDAHIELAAESARQGIVLLKNDNNVLPLNKDKYKKLAVGGPELDAQTTMVGNYAGNPCRFVTPRQGLAPEADLDAPGDSHLKDAAANADATIIFAGLNKNIEYEGLDRWDLFFPQDQIDLINNVAPASKGPLILVIFSAGGIDLSFVKDNPQISAIIWAGYPGAEGGRAVADILYGRQNPAGRLPITWYYNNYTEALPETSMQLRPNDDLGYPGRTYKFFNGSTVYPFGYGLSYTKFNYTVQTNTTSVNQALGKYQKCVALSYTANTTAPACPSVQIEDISCDGVVEFEVKVSNVGSVDGANVIMVFSKPPSEVLGAPIKQLVAFERVFVRAGQAEVVKFSINACQSFGIVEKTAYLVLPSGEHSIVVGVDDDALSFPVQVQFSQ